jgi:hypothetical protein
MFIRFRQTKSTLQATLLVGRRVAGRVRHEQLASLGSIKLAQTIDGREGFWRELHATLARLGNRVPGEEQAKIMGQVHGRIPLVTADERREHEIGLAEREQRLWDGMRELLAERASGLADMASRASADGEEARKSAEDAGTRAVAATDRIDRWRRGDASVLRGQEVDLEKILRDAGWTTADIDHALVVARLPEAVAVAGLRDISRAAGERAARAAARRLLRDKS